MVDQRRCPGKFRPGDEVRAGQGGNARHGQHGGDCQPALDERGVHRSVRTVAICNRNA